MIFLLALIICTYSCALDRGIETNPEITIPTQAETLWLTQRLVEDLYDQDFGMLADNLGISWTDTLCPGTQTPAVLYDDRCLGGIMWNCGEIYVAVSHQDPAKSCGTALPHEFGHCLYMQIDPHHSGCPDHSDAEFWAVIEAAKTETCARDW